MLASLVGGYPPLGGTIESYGFVLDRGGSGGIQAPYAARLVPIASDATYDYYGQEIVFETCSASVLACYMYVADTIGTPQPSIDVGWGARGCDLQSMVGALQGAPLLMRKSQPVIGRVTGGSVLGGVIPPASTVSVVMGLPAPRFGGNPFSLYVSMRANVASNVDVYGQVNVWRGDV